MRALLLFVLLFASPIWAECFGEDLLAAMPEAERAEISGLAEAQPYANGILWEARRGDQLIRLVGTMHFHDPRHDATLAQVTPWIESADTVLLEMGEGDEARLQAKIAKEPSLAFITEGPTLPDLLSEEDWQRLSAAMTERGTPSFFAAKMRPWMALVSLGLTKCVVEDIAQGKQGLDATIIALAREIGNPAQALEPYDTAVTLFGGYSDAEMIEFLSLYLSQDNIDPEDQNHTMVEAYFREEIRILWEFGVAQSLAQPMGMSRDEILAEYTRFEDLLITQRNLGWMDPILSAAEVGPVFVAVGALHMPGENGLLRLLERDGFEITRIKRQ